MSLRLGHRLRRFSSIAFFAIFGLAFAPAISQMLAQNSMPGSEICSVQGRPSLALDDSLDGAPVQHTAAGHLGHCPLCGLSATAVLPPPQAPSLVLPVGLRDAVPVLFLHAPRPLFTWHTSQPRAPPLSA